MKNQWAKNQAEGNFDNLSKETQDLVKELCLETFKRNCEVYSEVEPEEIECERRDGFIPFDHNRGGVIVKGFTDIYSLWASGVNVGHALAQAEIDRQVEYGFECAVEGFKEKFKDELKVLNVQSKQVNYHDLYELSKITKNDRYGELAEELSGYERENLSDEQSSIMFEIQFMYHGQDDGKHTASVSCAVNTEGPYHRRSISWAPNVFCEGAKEVEIEWTTDAELKKALAKALKSTAKEVL